MLNRQGRLCAKLIFSEPQNKKVSITAAAGAADHKRSRIVSQRRLPPATSVLQLVKVRESSQEQARSQRLWIVPVQLSKSVF